VHPVQTLFLRAFAIPLPFNSSHVSVKVRTDLVEKGANAQGGRSAIRKVESIRNRW
jgi:hypothetical protein